MTTPEPRVRVVRDPWAPDAAVWCANCPYCGIVAKHRWGWQSAMYDAADHLQDPCDGLRLAWLVRELEALRDRLTDEIAYAAQEVMREETRKGTPYFQWITRESAIRWARTDLTVIIDRAGGTGC